MSKPRIVICEEARVDELRSDLADAGVTQWSAFIQHGGWGDPLSDVRWVGIEPSPSGYVSELRAPIEGVDRPPKWESWADRWWFTRDLVAFRVDV